MQWNFVLLQIHLGVVLDDDHMISNTLTCPTCSCTFRAQLCTPMIYGCGHNACSVCLDARTSAGEPGCGVCGHDGGLPVVNTVLAQYCKAVQTQCPVTTLRPLAPIDPELHVKCRDAADGMDTRCETISLAKEELIGSAVVAFDDFRVWVNRVHAQLDDHRRQHITEAKQMCKSTGKAMEAKVDELTVSASQLHVCAAVCDRVLGGPTGRSSCIRDTLEYSRRAVAQLSELASAQSGDTVHMELTMDSDTKAVLMQHAIALAVMHHVCIHTSAVYTCVRVLDAGHL